MTRPPFQRRPGGLTMLGQAAVWHFEQSEARAARPADATAACACCDGIYDVRGLAALKHDYTYGAVASACFERGDLLCAPCRRSFEAEFGTRRPRNEGLEEEWEVAKAGVLPAHLLNVKRATTHDDIQAHQERADEERDNYSGIFF